MSSTLSHDEHYDPEGSKIGMWLYLFTELFLFGGLFLVFAVFMN
jgi:cytochrome c oxidase subunit 3